MSTRALRKLQLQREREGQLAALTAAEEVEDTQGSEDEPIHLAQAKSKRKRKDKLNLYHMLDLLDKDEDVHPESETDKAGVPFDGTSMTGTSTPQSGKSTKKKKKKDKAKTKGKQCDSSATKQTDAEELQHKLNEVDEIDRALLELNTKESHTNVRIAQHPKLMSTGSDHPWEREVSSLLAVDTKHLNPSNEMRSLFGSIALERTTRDQSRQDQERMVDLETALDGRHSPANRGKTMGNLAKRRNLFMQGQENWPLATSGGLGMEVLPDPADIDLTSNLTRSIGKHYEVVHNAAYQDVQRQFRQAVESMSAEAMIHLLIYNPYHVATLLQVAEIARQQGDHSVTGDLLERALFTFGRSLHSTFGVAVREGRARVGFDKPANRELYLVIWRYIQNLEMRGTWRTAFEWSKMLLSFSILADPYGITHALDQYALRGRQHEALIELCSDKAFADTWSHLPNMQISLAVAYHRDSQPRMARQTLALAMHRYPYILSHLCSMLEISPLPRSLWGLTPSTDAEKFYSELYVRRAKDLWATPETTALLVEIAETLDSYSQIWKNASPAPKLEISLEDARHVLLLDIPTLIALIPRQFRLLPTAQYDVLPPPSSVDDAGLTARAPGTSDEPDHQGPMGFLAEMIRAASRGFLGGGGGGEAATEATTGQDTASDMEELSEVSSEELWNAALDNTNLSERQRVILLESMAPGTHRVLNDQEVPADTIRSVFEREAADVGTSQSQGTQRPTPTPTTATTPASHPLVATVEDADEVESSNNNISTSSATSTNISNNVAPSTDPQRTQRRLLTTALSDLQAARPGATDAYVRALRSLPARDKLWTLNMMAQRLGTTSPELAAEIRRRVLD